MSEMGMQLAEIMDPKVVTVDTTTGEVSSELIDKTFDGAGELVATKKELKILSRPIDPATVEVRPDGIVYLPWIHISRIMQEAFGLSWSLVPGEDPKINGGEVIWYHHLYIRGKYVGSAFGQCGYSERNRNMTYGDAVEGAHSDALRRCAKRLGIATELWDPNWLAQWKRHWVRREGSRSVKVIPPEAGVQASTRIPALPMPPMREGIAPNENKRVEVEVVPVKNGKFALEKIKDSPGGDAWIDALKKWGGGVMMADFTFLDALRDTKARGILRRMVLSHYLQGQKNCQLKERIETVLATRDGDKELIRERKKELKNLMISVSTTGNKYQGLLLGQLTDGDFTSFPQLDKANAFIIGKIIEKLEDRIDGKSSGYGMDYSRDTGHSDSCFADCLGHPKDEADPSRDTSDITVTGPVEEDE